jgi:uncharacterized membrane protein
LTWREEEEEVDGRGVKDAASLSSVFALLKKEEESRLEPSVREEMLGSRFREAEVVEERTFIFVFCKRKEVELKRRERRCLESRAQDERRGKPAMKEK